ncbi:MAG: hypothetical protein AAGG54_10435 [Pseudomonadota bacterium]
MVAKLRPPPRARSKPLPPRDWVYTAPGAYDGLLLPGVTDITNPRQLRALTPYLSVISELFCTELGILAVFETPAALDPANLGRALALKQQAGGAWVSYADAPDPPPRAALTCFLDGSVHTAPRHAWEALDPLDLWDLSALVPAPSSALPRRTDVEERPDIAQTARIDPVIQNVLSGEPSLVQERARIAAAEMPAIDQVADGVRRGALWLGRLGFTIAIAILAITALRLLGAVLQGNAGEGAFVGLALSFLILMIILRILRGGDAPVQGSGAQVNAKPMPGSRAARPAPPRQKRSDLLQRLNGWLIWNTPAGDRLRRGFASRLAETERLLAQGKIDTALKRALLMAERAGKEKAPLASRLPDIRSSLSLNFGQRHGGASLPMGGQDAARLRRLYAELARTCQEEGDYGRAAFIYDELLGDPAGAVRMLEAGERFEDAAKLAMSRDRPGAEIVRLWYRAGHRDIAIALAERYSCFETLVREAESHDPQAGHFLRGIWAERLAETGDLETAIAVIDGVPGLEARRLRWLALAIGEGGLENPGIFHRAVLALPWRGAIFHDASSPDPESVGGALERKILEVVAPSGESGPRSALLDYLINTATQKNRDKAPLAAANCATLIDHLLRVTLAEGAPLTKNTLKNTRALAQAAHLGVLATELKHIRRAEPARAPDEVTHRLTPRAPGLPDWSHVLCLPQNRLLLADDSGALRLAGRDGRVEWRDRVTDLAGLVRIRNGRFVVVILGHDPKSRRLLLLDTHRHAYTPLGFLPLEAWHRETNEQIWLVKSGDRIQALSVAALFEDVPSFRESWGITLRERVVMLGFVQTANAVGWFLQRWEGPEQFGLIESWIAATKTLSFNTFLIEPAHEEGAAPANFYTDPVAIQGASLQLVSGPRAGKIAPTRSRSYSYEAEQSLKAEHARLLSSLRAPAPMRPYGSGPLVIEEEGGTDATVQVSIRSSLTLVRLGGTEWRASDTTPDYQTSAVIDAEHRVILIERQAGGPRVTTPNV